jgi:hypothetical protein
MTIDRRQANDFRQEMFDTGCTRAMGSTRIEAAAICRRGEPILASGHAQDLPDEDEPLAAERASLETGRASSMRFLAISCEHVPG